MSSVDNILGLVSHLHSMESSFSAILIEAAMKLASLTDANLFILVETKDGRRFAGKNHLCSLYTSGQLSPAGTDLEMEVDPSVIGLRARYVGTDGNDATLSTSDSTTTSRHLTSNPDLSSSPTPDHTLFSTRLSHSSSSSKRRRVSTDDDDDFSTPSKSPSVEGRAEGDHLTSHNKRLKFEAVDLKGSSFGSSVDDPDSITLASDAPLLAPLDHTMTNSASQTDFFVDQGYAEPFASQFIENQEEFKTLLQNQSGCHFEGGSMTTSQPLTLSQYSSVSNRRLNSSESPERRPYEEVCGWNTTEFLAQSVRANNVLGICDSSIADKSSSNHRLFMSLVHEYTKESVKYVPESKLDRKDFVDKIFFNFWLYFPHLETLHNLGAKISIGKRFYFLKAFVRAGIARGLSSILGRRATYAQESSEDVKEKRSLPLLPKLIPLEAEASDGN